MSRHPLSDVRTTTTPIHRVITCPVCGRWSARIARHGIPGGALAAALRLRAQLAGHLRDAHPDEIARASCAR